MAICGGYRRNAVCIYLLLRHFDYSSDEALSLIPRMRHPMGKAIDSNACLIYELRETAEDIWQGENFKRDLAKLEGVRERNRLLFVRA